MKYVRLFEQFVNEVIDPSSAYPYKFVEGEINNYTDTIHSMIFSFRTKKNGYAVVLRYFNNPKEGYELVFRSQGTYNTLTGEGDALRIFATVLKILEDTINGKYGKLQKIPIYIKGAWSSNNGRNTENRRDRIYKNIALKHANRFPNYKFVTLNDGGFELRPKNLLQKMFGKKAA